MAPSNGRLFLSIHAMTNQLLRTRNGCFKLTSNSWGQFLAPVDDPDANVTLTKAQLEGFELHDGIHKMPHQLWNSWMQLCFDMLKIRDLEVSCRFLRSPDGEQWRIAIPPQNVGGAHVDACFDGAIDIETGEFIEEWPPEGWLPCGSSHSHNTMDAFFSGTDDKYELGDPGLHIVVGKLNPKDNNYALKASITACRRRFIVDSNAVIDFSGHIDDTIGYHPDVLTVIDTTTPKLTQWPAAAQLPMTPSMMNRGNGYPSEYNDVWHDVAWPAQRDCSDELDTLREQVVDLTNFILSWQDAMTDAIDNLATQQ